MYLFLCSWAIARTPFFRRVGLPLKHVLIYFWIKVAAAVGYGFYHAAVQKGGDTWSYHRSGLIEAELLRSHPINFITTLFYSGYPEKWGGFFSTQNSWWNDLDDNTIPKLLAVCNLFSGSNYYINAIFINFLFLIGPLFLYRSWSKALPGARAFWRYLPFMLPSFLFWTSGIHKEGFLFMALALVVHALLSFTQNKAVVKNALLLLTALMLIMVLRNFLLLPVLWVIIYWSGVTKFRLRPAVNFGAVIVLTVSLFFASGWLAPKLNLPYILYERRVAFLQKKGFSKTETVQLQPTLNSYIQNAPAAFITGALRPLPADAYNSTLAIAAAESILMFLLPGIAVFTLRNNHKSRPLVVLCLLLSVPVFLIIGYTIPFLGAVVRYRSIVLPFWMMSLILTAAGRFRQK